MSDEIKQYIRDLENSNFKQLSKQQGPDIVSAVGDLNVLIAQIGGQPNAINQMNPCIDSGSNVVLVNTYLILRLFRRIEDLERLNNIAPQKAVTEKSYSCGVKNCGNGKCIHEPLKEPCPKCGGLLVKVKPTGHIFCSSDFNNCGYERDS